MIITVLDYLLFFKDLKIGSTQARAVFQLTAKKVLSSSKEAIKKAKT
jgi:hypothetical protein